MSWRLIDVLVALVALAVVTLVLRYAKAIIRTVMFLGGVFFLVITVVVVAVAAGWWRPNLMDVLKVVVR
jgi:hypothetical protein